MGRLKFEMWEYRRNPDSEANGFMSRFTDGTGKSTDSWWCSPPLSIDHVGPEYLKYSYRHPNVRNARHIEFIKRRYKEEILKVKGDRE
ncbi:hypothetical protein D3C87_1272460 [compost metagenome]